MSNEKDIIDLVPSDDGTYEVKKPKVEQVQVKPKQKPKPTYNRDNMDQLFLGVDAGMEFVEGATERLSKFMKFVKAL